MPGRQHFIPNGIFLDKLRRAEAEVMLQALWAPVGSPRLPDPEKLRRDYGEDAVQAWDEARQAIHKLKIALNLEAAQDG